MRTISLLKTTIKGDRNGTEFPVNTLEIIVASSNQGPKEGLDMKTIRARLRLDKAIDALTSESTKLNLDDADFKTLQDIIEPVRWLGRNVVVDTLISELFVDEDVTVSEMRAV